MSLYIDKYWNNYIGGTDDSLTLVDYLYDKGRNELSLGEIFADTGLAGLDWDFHASPGLGYTDAGGVTSDFYYAINIVTDLAALFLECSVNGGFNIRDLYAGEKRDLFIRLTASGEEHEALNRALADFAQIRLVTTCAKRQMMKICWLLPGTAKACAGNCTNLQAETAIIISKIRISAIC